ncbi:MAG: iron ABC transporter permease [Candidatus Tectomicrobia bacterium]|nr:iron ABC transporter permease [Candidatus Tectomicrobia bacterium]
MKTASRQETDHGARLRAAGQAPTGDVLPAPHSGRWPLLLLVLLAAVFAALVAGTLIGPTEVSWGAVRASFWRLVTLRLSLDGPPEEIIILFLRMPRVLLAGLVGASLAVAGVIMQALFRNPMAEAGIIGVTSGGAFFGILSLRLGLAAATVWALPASAFAGAFAVAFSIYLLAGGGRRESMYLLLLIGLAFNSIFSSLIALVLTTTPNYELARQMQFWMLGGLEGRSWEHVWLLAPFAFTGIIICRLHVRTLNVLLLSDDSAASLGLNVERVRAELLTVAAMLAGGAVAVSGTIAFVGLIVPHICRLIAGANHRHVVPASVLLGASFLIVSDILARSLFTTTELRLGIVTSLIGGPFFIHLLLSSSRQFRR